MRVVVQRVSRACVTVAGEVVGEISRPGLAVLVGVTHADTAQTAQRLARKVCDLRIMRDPDGSASGTGRADEASALDVGAAVLVVSQFTLYGDTRKGRRPSWVDAAPGPVAEPLVDAFAAAVADLGLEVARGRFGADMAVELVNDGPFTLVLEV
ncbi:D-aminoacyl-tRNA deacylase [Kineosporia sp. R_H_3]|uniref:D-aminoacyl-tRNA deacylase n=1 Tax=Kineosporia sp. R_H_3 TaxID=1961848 RepID=UPI000B4BB00B|nr:D-aminoacyl-tRNA deacylase [Kineosporia sp. R_H_3]